MATTTRWIPGIAAGLLACGLLARGATGAVVVPDAVEQDNPAATETITRTLRFSGSGERTLDVRVIRGSIRVTTSADSTVRLDIRRVTRAESAADAREAASDVTLEFLDNAATVGVVARERSNPGCGEEGNYSSGRRRPRYRVSFEVTVAVPRGTRLELCAINDGTVLVDGTTGDFDISHVNGPVALNDVDGSGRVETVNGPITVSFTEAPRTASSFKTVNGDVAVTLPRGLSADLAMKTFNGDLLTDFEVQPLPGRVPTPERRGPRLVYRSNDFTRVRVARGGPELSFESLNGDVRVLRAAR